MYPVLVSVTRSVLLMLISVPWGYMKNFHPKFSEGTIPSLYQQQDCSPLFPDGSVPLPRGAAETHRLMSSLLKAPGKPSTDLQAPLPRSCPLFDTQAALSPGNLNSIPQVKTSTGSTWIPFLAPWPENSLKALSQ